MSPAEERRSGSDRRIGVERRSGQERRGTSGREDADHRLLSRAIWVGNWVGGAGRETELGGLPLRQIFPHAQFDEREAADRSVAIAAHRGELSARLGREVGLSVAALDYLLNMSRDLVAPAIVEREVLEVLEHRSVTDPLTGLFNRYHFELTLKREVARCLRHRTRLSLLLVDVDRLKAVNDRWGHQGGDRVLCRVAGAIRTSLRGTDIASRYGGDEFAIILPDTDARAGRVVAERICTKVAASLEEGLVPDASTPVTVSGGLAEVPFAATATSEAELVVAADQALYLAKGSGGNCVAEGS
ncbi:MAG TPA: GGDEF domain-containing protein [Gemmatimonadales bacterium]